MKRFIAYFDYLGFAQFIKKNDLSEQSQIINNIFRDMEIALGKDKYEKTPHGVFCDISKSQINCINFSDTVVFFTNDDSETSLIELLEVSYKFNWQAINFTFPVRGALVYGEIVQIDFKQKNSGGGIYNINSVYGKGLVNAHSRAEEQHWAGTVLDETFTSEIINRGHNLNHFFLDYAKKYKVPYKDKTDRNEEYVLNIIKGNLSEEAYRNISESIRHNFAQYKKCVSDERVQQKISNTLHFLESYILKEEQNV